MLKTLLALTLTVLALGCGGEPLDVPGDAPECEMVELAQSDLNPCAYVLPAGSDCHAIRVFVDGGELTPEQYSSTCVPPYVTLLECDGAAKSVAVCVK